MFKQIKIYTALIAFLLSMWGCDKLIYDQQDDGRGGPKVYLTVSYGGVANFRSSVNESDDPNAPTINKDGIDFEDRVHDLILFVFDTTSGNLVDSYTDSNIQMDARVRSFQIEISPGQRDFYFVANVLLTELSGIKTRDDLDRYMKQFRELSESLYLSSSMDLAFPMARVYYDKKIERGGSISFPVPFEPDGPGVPILLRRAVAQLQVNLHLDDNNSGMTYGVKNIYYKNAFRKYSLQWPNNLPTETSDKDKYTSENANSTYGNPLRKSDNSDSYYYYMPEALLSDVAWLSNKNQINYFVIETLDGNIYEIPIITADDYKFGDNYLDFATGKKGVDQDYNIHRNRRYVYTIKNLANIEIDYDIDPWNKETKSLYMGYGYNVEADETPDDDGNISVSIANTLGACPPHVITLKAVNGAKFVSSNSTDDNTIIVFDNDTPLLRSDNFKINLDSHIDGNAYLEVYFNNYVKDANPASIPVKEFTL